MLEVMSRSSWNLGALEPLLAMGYDAYRLLPGPLMLAPFDPLEAKDGFLLNLFACKRDRARKLAESGLLATIGTPGSGSLGSLQAGALEMSNVDLSQEFTNLIVAQRGFQANARIITTSDEVLQELNNLKR